MTEPLIVADTSAPFDFFKKHGYYQVGNRAFAYRIRALQEATRTGQTVRWIFNDDVYSSLDWRTPTRIDLNELYRLRAQQLRQSYDYLLLYFSGGADSTVVLQSFINNNIPLDEVVVGWPVSQSQGKYQPNAQDHTARNMISEWDYSIKPALDWLAQYHPKIKITVCDILDQPKNIHYDEHTVTLVDNHSFIGVNRNLELDRVLQKRTEQYKNVAGIVGASPLECAVADDNYLVTYFLDSAVTGVLKSDYTDVLQYQRNIEFFFWTPDMPELVREQSHAILDHLRARPELKTLLPQAQLSNTGLKIVEMPKSEARRNFRKSVLYPSWREKFQVDKPRDVIGYSVWQSWWHDNEHSKEFVSAWAHAVTSEIALVDLKYFELRPGTQATHNLLSVSLHHQSSGHDVINYYGMISKFYPVGRVSHSQD